MGNLIRISILSAMLCLFYQNVYAGSIYYAVQAGGDDGIYKVDMNTGASTKIYSGSLTTGIKQFDTDQILVTDYVQGKIKIIDAQNGSINKEFTAAYAPHISVVDPENPQNIIYSSYYAGQVRTLNTQTGSDTYLASFTQANRLIFDSNNVPYVFTWPQSASWYPNAGSVYNVDTGSFVANTDYVSDLIMASDGDIYFTGHTGWTNTIIYKLDVDNKTVSTLYSGSQFISGITYDEQNNRLLSFVNEGAGGISLYEFGFDGNRTKLLGGVNVPAGISPWSGGYAYTLYLNEEIVNAVPEPSTICLFLVSLSGLFRGFIYKKK